MRDEELEQDELDGEEEVEDEGFAAGTSDDDDGDDDGDAAPVSRKAKKAEREDTEELPSIEAKQKERDALERAMAEFLARGGKIQEVEANVVADPPKKPEGKYGSRPI